MKYYGECLRFDQEINNPANLASDYGNMANALDGLGELSRSPEDAARGPCGIQRYR